jgi:hypothetical protein
MKDFFSFKYLLPLILLLIYIIFNTSNFGIYVLIGLMFFSYITIRLIDNTGYKLTIKEIFFSILLLQYFIAPLFVYYKFDNDVGDFGYEMKIPADEYFYFLSGVIIFTFIGLFLPIFNDRINQKELFEKIKFLDNNFNVGIILIVVSFLSYLLIPFLPSSFAFLGIFLSNLKYVGIFYLYYSNNKSKNFYIILVISFLILNIISGGVFIDLFIWGLFFITYLTINKKINLLIKLGALGLGIFIALLIQSIKGEYRKIIWDESNSEVNEELVFLDLVNVRLENVSTIFEDVNLKNFISRINQGWILTNVLNHVPQNEDFSNGELFIKELKGILLPRVLAPDKVTASGRDVQQKFIKYTGRILYGNTTMNVGIISDGYINFGKVGCWIYMFFIGLFLNFLIHKIIQLTTKYPTLIFWLPVLFFYVVRSANDFYMIMNYLVKSLFILVFLFYLFKNTFFKPQIA